jgi:hypothetical protein
MTIHTADAKSHDQALWEDLVNRRADLDREHRAAFNLAEQNADDTSAENHFGTMTPEWFRYFADTYESVLDDMTPGLAGRWGF